MSDDAKPDLSSDPPELLDPARKAFYARFYD
jgi:hypothetical protein